MRKLLIAAAALLLAGCTPRQAPPTPPAQNLRTVVRVIDGDTLELDREERVRLIGIDTPETVHPQNPVECFGREASAEMKRLVEGRQVRLEFDREEKDRYGRSLAYMYLPDGTFVNAQMIRGGFAHAYTRFPFRYLEQFRALEREAREGSRGLWGAGCPVPR